MKTAQSVRNLMDLTGRVALVTGGAGHIGQALCEALAELGAAIVVLDLPESRCAQVAEEIGDTYRVRAMPLAIDLTNEKLLRSTPSLVLDRFGRIDILVNCAGLVGTSDLKGWAVPFLDQSADTFKLALAVNLTCPFLLTQACFNLLAASGSGHGSVVNIGSIYGMVGPDIRLYEGTGMGSPGAYAASKGGLLQLTRWLATISAPKVRVNSITPGGVWRDQPAVFRDRYVARTPLGRMATENDLKGAIAYLASDLSAYVTGQNLVVDGGWTVW